jgi:hypothetical protein
MLMERRCRVISIFCNVAMIPLNWNLVSKVINACRLAGRRSSDLRARKNERLETASVWFPATFTSWASKITVQLAERMVSIPRLAFSGSGLDFCFCRTSVTRLSGNQRVRKIYQNFVCSFERRRFKNRVECFIRSVPTGFCDVFLNYIRVLMIRSDTEMLYWK